MDLVQLLPFAAPFFAAFFGAASAFVFGATREYRQRRRRQLDQINVAIYGLVMTAETLLNLKRQFLIAHQAEFQSVQAILVRMDPSADAATTAQIFNEVSHVFLASC